MGKLDGESSAPSYQQLMEIIQNRILNGELKENDRIPTEVELSREYDISRITARKAVEPLVEEEILVKRQGIGTSAPQRKLCRNISGFMGSTQSCLVGGNMTGVQLVSTKLAEAIMVDVEELKIQGHEEIIRIVWVRTCGGIPAMLEENRSPVRFAYLLGHDLTGSIYQILVENRTIMDSGIKRIGTRQANEIEHRHLGMDLDGPLLYVRDVSYDRKGDPVHNCRSVINPDHYKMTVMTNAREKADRE